MDPTKEALVAAGAAFFGALLVGYAQGVALVPLLEFALFLGVTFGAANLYFARRRARK
ncbi:hypothetical protein [Natronomonas sp. EA1]|uniref:hypothetical protein n=1 Tax=Natronomonas sp. EA1 TaxID=3421655 RepID=UPI003EBE1809